MAIWSVVRRKVFNGCNSSYSSSIIGKSWKCKSSTASHTRYYGALSKETSVFVRGSPVSLPCYLGSSLSSNAIMRVTVPYNHTFNTSIRLFSSDEGGSVDAVVPYMGESISDGTLATILKSGSVDAVVPYMGESISDGTLATILKSGSVDAVVPYMGESISDGTLATILKSGSVDAVVPYMGESISDGTLATILKSGSVDAVVPYMGESISDGTLATILKKPGDRVEADEPIAQIETDKVTIDVSSPTAGTIEKIVAKEGDTVEPGFKIAVISKSSGAATNVEDSEKKPEETKPEKKEEKPKPVAESPPSPKVETSPPKEKSRAPPPPPPASGASPREPQLPPKDRERRVPMTRLRKRVATRLKDSQNTFALLTTFNEVDMTNLMKLRSEYKDAFLEKHGVKLGLMSGFIKGAISALQNQPVVNAVIDGEDIIYRDYVDISIAVGTPKGLVVPVLRNVEQMNFAEIEKEINRLAKKATAGTISIDEMAGGTFTISNGGVYGSLLSTPIINPPQSAILGMHSILNRPMVVGGEVMSRPMMYIALTYDHRLIDGREAVLFLRRIKDVVEDPRRLLLDI